MIILHTDRFVLRINYIARIIRSAINHNHDFNNKYALSEISYDIN